MKVYHRLIKKSIPRAKRKCLMCKKEVMGFPYIKTFVTKELDKKFYHLCHISCFLQVGFKDGGSKRICNYIEKNYPKEVILECLK